MRLWINNLKLVVWSWPSILVGLLFSGWFAYMVEYFSNRDLIAGNYGHTYATINLTIDIITVIWIGLFVASVIYKMIAFKSITSTNHFGWLGWFFSALVAGCASCGLTLATYLGLASILTLLPWGWLEVKVVGLVILFRSIWKNIKDLLICKIKSK